MQLMPGTGRMYARKVGMKGFTTASLLQPETNVRLGTTYFKDLVDRFGGVHYALAGYNAGEHRVVRWQNEAPGLPTDEFIDNIPSRRRRTTSSESSGRRGLQASLRTGLLDPNERLTARR